MTASLAELIEAIKIVLSGDTSLLILLLVLFGVTLGYISVKVFRYLLSLVIILLLGALLSLWSLNEHVNTVVAGVKEVAVSTLALLLALGLLSAGPFTLGFLIGALLAVVKE